MKTAFGAEQPIVQAWIERLPETLRNKARSAIREIEILTAGYTFELRIKNGGDRLWFVEGKQASEEQKTQRPFVILEKCPISFHTTFSRWPTRGRFTRCRGAH